MVPVTGHWPSVPWVQSGVPVVAERMTGSDHSRPSCAL
jgi:hypothetical protein